MVIFQIHVDTVDVAPILENIKFPKPTTPGKGPNRPSSPMNEHPHNALTENQVPAAVTALGVELAPTGTGTGTELIVPPGLPTQELPLLIGKTKSRGLRKLLLIGASLLALSGTAHIGWEYWTVGRFQVSTDDAYVKADSTTIAPKVSGYIGEVLVADNEQVKAGQVLARIDDRDYRAALDESKADLDAAKAAAATKQAMLTAQQSVIDGARATIAVDQANLTFDEQEDNR
jgi:membrane fusion protein (multidrug efflux system)